MPKERKYPPQSEGEKRCNRCGENRKLTEFHANPERKDGRTTLCKHCRSRNPRASQDDFTLLEDPVHLEAVTFWRLWRKWAVVPIEKYYLSRARNAEEGRIIKGAIRELDKYLLELQGYFHNLLGRLRDYRDGAAALSDVEKRKKASKAHKVLGIPMTGKIDKRTLSLLRKSYHSISLACHPDKGTGREEEFIEAQQAYHFLVGYYRDLGVS